MSECGYLHIRLDTSVESWMQMSKMGLWCLESNTIVSFQSLLSYWTILQYLLPKFIYLVFPLEESSGFLSLGGFFLFGFIFHLHIIITIINRLFYMI